MSPVVVKEIDGEPVMVEERDEDPRLAAFLELIDAMEEALDDMSNGHCVCPDTKAWMRAALTGAKRKPISRGAQKMEAPRDQEAVSALDEWFHAHDAYHRASATYNDRLRLVRAERERGNWSMSLNAEYDVLNHAQACAFRANEALYLAELRQRKG